MCFFLLIKVKGFLKNMENKNSLINSLNKENLNDQIHNRNSFESMYGIGAVLISRIASTTLNFLIKLLFVQTNITVFEIAYFRSLILFLGVYFHSKLVGIEALNIEHVHYSLILIRMIFGYLSNIISFYQYKILPLSISMII